MKRLIIDVREPYEFESGHAKGAINIPPHEIMSGSPQLKDTPKDAEIIVYCKSGSRSHVTKMILEQQGFTNIINGINKDQVTAKYL